MIAVWDTEYSEFYFRLGRGFSHRLPIHAGSVMRPVSCAVPIRSPTPNPGLERPKYDATHVLSVNAKFMKDWSCTSIMKPITSLGVLSVRTFYFKDELFDIAAFVALNGVSVCSFITQ
jgi:hypothetical protein